MKKKNKKTSGWPVAKRLELFWDGEQWILTAVTEDTGMFGDKIPSITTVSMEFYLEGAFKTFAYTKDLNYNQIKMILAWVLKSLAIMATPRMMHEVAIFDIAESIKQD